MMPADQNVYTVGFYNYAYNTDSKPNRRLVFSRQNQILEANAFAWSDQNWVHIQNVPLNLIDVEMHSTSQKVVRIERARLTGRPIVTSNVLNMVHIPPFSQDMIIQQLNPESGKRIEFGWDPELPYEQIEHLTIFDPR
jgi:hypothetical protein